MTLQITDVKEQLKQYREELEKICPSITVNRRKMFLQDTIDIINIQIREGCKTNDIVVCDLASMILQRL